MASFLDLQRDVYARLGQQESPPTEVSTRIKRYINRWDRRVKSSKGMTALRRVIVTKASVADRATYGVALKSIKWMTEASTERRLFEKTMGWYRSHCPDPSRWTGTPLYYVPIGYSRIHTQPGAAGAELFVKSTSVSDTTQVAKVEAVTIDGYTRSLSVTLTGTTAVTLSASVTDVVDVQDFYLSAVGAGTVTLHQASGAGTELSRIPIGQKEGRFLRYALVPTPSQVITYVIDGEAPMVDLVNDTDEPIWDADFHDILVDGAVHDEWINKGLHDEARGLFQQIDERIKQLRMSILEWDEATHDDERERTFDETIQLPVEDAP